MFPDSQPYVKYGQGDGTVNGRSLVGCQVWNRTKTWAFDHHIITKGGEHMAILANQEMLDYVTNILGL